MDIHYTAARVSGNDDEPDFNALWDAGLKLVIPGIESERWEMMSSTKM